MSVDKNTIKSELISLYTNSKNGITDEAFADEMADIIKNAILSALVNSGIAVQVNTETGTGATIGTGNLS